MAGSPLLLKILADFQLRVYPPAGRLTKLIAKATPLLHDCIKFQNPNNEGFLQNTSESETLNS